MIADDRRRRYVKAALVDAEGVVSALTDGRRTGAFAAAAGIGNLVPHLIAFDDAEARLVAASMASGKSQSEARSHVRRGLKYGMRTPRFPSFGEETGAVAVAYPVGIQAHVHREDAPHFPPADEVAALWDAARRVHEDDEVREWLVSRGLDPDTVEQEVGMVALPRDAALPAWAGTRAGTWPATGHRALFPCFDATGALVNLRARAVVPLAENAVKSLAPWGFAVRGAVLCDHVGRSVLAGKPSEAWSGDVVVTEGEPDLCTWATNRGDGAESVPAVLGVVSGAWTRTLADRIPAGARVALLTHDDKAGGDYAEAVARSLANRCTVFRRPARAA